MASSVTESVVATIISLISVARRKRSMTRAKTVLPPRSINTFPGNRLLPIRAWIIAVIFNLLSYPACRLSLEMRQNFVYRANYVVNVSIYHAVKHRQADQAFISSFRHGMLPTHVSEAIAVVWVQVNWDVVDIHTNIFGAQRLKYFSSIRTEVG